MRIPRLTAALSVALALLVSACAEGGSGVVVPVQQPGSLDAKKGDKQEDSGEEDADQPVVVAGTYLTCAVLKNPKAEPSEVDIGCRVDGGAEARSLRELQSFKWNMKLLGKLSANLSVGLVDHPTGSKYWDGIFVVKQKNAAGLTGPASSTRKTYGSQQETLALLTAGSKVAFMGLSTRGDKVYRPTPKMAANKPVPAGLTLKYGVSEQRVDTSQLFADYLGGSNQVIQPVNTTPDSSNSEVSSAINEPIFVQEQQSVALNDENFVQYEPAYDPNATFVPVQQQPQQISTIDNSGLVDNSVVLEGSPTIEASSIPEYQPEYVEYQPEYVPADQFVDASQYPTSEPYYPPQ